MREKFNQLVQDLIKAKNMYLTRKLALKKNKSNSRANFKRLKSQTKSFKMS